MFRIFKSVILVLVIVLLSLSIYSSSASQAACNNGACNGFTKDNAPIFTVQYTSLTTIYHEVIRGDYVANGTSLRNEPWDIITINGIPAGATIEKSFLVWAILNDTIVPSTIMVNGTLFNGVLAGTDIDYCWGADHSYVFYADVTSVVTGNGVYNVSGYPTGVADFSDPWGSFVLPFAEGASLIVIYSLPTEPLREIVVLIGDISTVGFPIGTPINATININYPIATPIEAKNTWIVADGQNNFLYDRALFEGVVVAGPGSSIRVDDAFPGLDHRTGASSHGALWDTLTIDVSDLVSPGDTSFIASIQMQNDCLGYVANIFSIKVETKTPAVVGGEIIESNGSIESFMSISITLVSLAIAITYSYSIYRKKH
ncbi:MAG: hypothetical protein DRO40_02180 [Thermoprotei archaeon]|nr:MAG: hypothetical protein DRO40_02180 [Thermoprotei archaeon]